MREQRALGDVVDEDARAEDVQQLDYLARGLGIPERDAREAQRYAAHDGACCGLARRRARSWPHGDELPIVGSALYRGQHRTESRGEHGERRRHHDDDGVPLSVVDTDLRVGVLARLRAGRRRLDAGVVRRARTRGSSTDRARTAEGDGVLEALHERFVRRVGGEEATAAETARKLRRGPRQRRPRLLAPRDEEAAVECTVRSPTNRLGEMHHERHAGLAIVDTATSEMRRAPRCNERVALHPARRHRIDGVDVRAEPERGSLGV